MKNSHKNQTKENELEFATYCIFSQDEQKISETIGLMFKDYLGSLNVKNNQD